MADLKQVTFTAYAFNEYRVKSTTASATLKGGPNGLNAGIVFKITPGVR